MATAAASADIAVRRCDVQWYARCGEDEHHVFITGECPDDRVEICMWMNPSKSEVTLEVLHLPVPLPESSSANCKFRGSTMQCTMSAKLLGGVVKVRSRFAWSSIRNSWKRQDTLLHIDLACAPEGSTLALARTALRQSRAVQNAIERVERVSDMKEFQAFIDGLKHSCEFMQERMETYAKLQDEQERMNNIVEDLVGKAHL